MGVTEPEINARLDSLCLSMTEHALGGFNEWSTASYNGKTRHDLYNLIFFGISQLDIFLKA